MADFDNKKSMRRFRLVAIIATLGMCVIVGKAFYIMTAQASYWMEVGAGQKKINVSKPSVRGNILSCDGQLMASSLPEFRIFLDFQAIKDAGNDSVFCDSLKYICAGLNEIFPEKSIKQFEDHLLQGYRKGSRHWPIWKERINYNTFKEVKALPLFCRSKYKSGFHYDEINARRRPFGSLAQRTIGEMYAEKDSGRTPRCGLELSYDKLLRGTNGIIHRQRVRDKYLDITDTPPIDGADIVTTIDVNMQDLAERSVLEELKEINGNVGVAIVMEVKTGDIKAIVNMERCIDGKYREIQNHAVSDLLEPGSVFKTASILAALNDGVVDTLYSVQTGGGVWDMYGRDMKDWNWSRGGYGTLTLPWTLKYSSNIGVSRIIDLHYHKNPEKFVQDLYDFGLTTDYKIPIVGYSPAKIRKPKKNKRGKYVNWPATRLAWMSIGYETQVPPISTLAFYNAIANDGKLMRPRFVKKIVKDGEVLAEYPPVVVKQQIAKPEPIKQIKRILREVVSEGLGKKAGSDKFEVAGKTGTAQMSKGALGYKQGGVDYLLSFAGYFPADAPRYSCIVCIQKHGLPASGGGMSGVVFHNIAEGIMAQDLKLSVTDARDEHSVLIPEVKRGNLFACDLVLNTLGFDILNGWKGTRSTHTPLWGYVENSSKTFSMKEQTAPKKGIVPDVHGMGARDAVYLMDYCGVTTRINGRGVVTKQSIGAGEKVKKGMVCDLKLE